MKLSLPRIPSHLAPRLTLLALLPAAVVLAQSAPSKTATVPPAGDAAFPPATAPSSQPANPVAAATAIPGNDAAKTPVEAARAYVSLVKAGTPRAASTAFIDFDGFASRSFGDDYKKATPAEQLEIRELLKSLIYLEFLPPQLPPLLASLNYDEFKEVLSPMADATDVEYTVTGPQIRAKQKITLQQINGTWRIVDVWQGPMNISKALGQMWGQAKTQTTLVNFCRHIVVPPQLQQAMQQRGQPQQPDDHEGPPQGPGQGPAQGPAAPPAPAQGPALP